MDEHRNFRVKLNTIKAVFSSLEPALSSPSTDPFNYYWFYWALYPCYASMREIAAHGTEQQKEEVQKYLNRFNELEMIFKN